MQFGIFSVGDVTMDPTTGRTPSEHEAGLPLKTVLEQLDILGEEVVPVLRKEFAIGRPDHVPDAPTHRSLLTLRDAEKQDTAEPTR